MSKNIKLRNDYEISDEEFEKTIEQFDNDLDTWFLEHKDIIEEFVAYYISKGIEYNCLWNGAFVGLVNGAIDTLSGYFVGKNVDRSKLNTILSEKYNLRLIQEKPMKFQKIK